MAIGVAYWQAERELLRRFQERIARVSLADLVIEAGLLLQHATNVGVPRLERHRSRACIQLIRAEVARRQQRGEA